MDNLKGFETEIFRSFVSGTHGDASHNTFITNLNKYIDESGKDDDVKQAAKETIDKEKKDNGKINLTTFTWLLEDFTAVIQKAGSSSSDAKK